jgi:DNA-binding NarL/FixJ family response regulator
MKVHITDDHKLVVEGYRVLLENNNINVVGSSTNGQQVIDWFQTNNADVLILDISMPVKNGIEVVAYFKNYQPELKIIIVSEYLKLTFIEQTIGNGAWGYVSKSFAAASIIDAIHKVYDGEYFFSLDIQEFLINTSLSFKQDQESNSAIIILEKSLSQQEINILLMHVKKYNSIKISEKLKISESTVRSYIARIKDKLNLNPEKGHKERIKYLKSN